MANTELLAQAQTQPVDLARQEQRSGVSTSRA